MFVKELRHVPYESALRRMYLLSLTRKRISGDFIFLYKVARGLIDFPWDTVFAASTSSGLRGHVLKNPMLSAFE